MKITCEIIGDLLPLYVDQMLSCDSRCLVEEHLKECESCQELLEELKRESKELKKISAEEEIEPDAKAALKGIRRTILKKRLLSVCIAVICVLVTVRVRHYFYAEKEVYISYEDSGLVMKGDKLYATKSYYGRLSSIISPDQKVQFLRFLETAEIRKLYPSEPFNELVTDYGDQIDPKQRTMADENRLGGIEKVYYLPEEYVHYQFNYEDPEIGKQQTEELESKSLLLWEKTEEAAEEPE